ncbi:ADP-ribose glycohydrolase MACROD1 isoform X1 [Boleophthalmus pectinirostris]|uniref:ADP-ribose glycohydrolase MACROD1 isoform X1 n=1 Tax=Boleophthalmus pectinirostris TaxID=150288 RepID=UPI00242B8065|nr:ADP-ribose glycohydrolase MACROD1 isoform X1 [Boleophthalmus pectinirostris]
MALKIASLVSYSSSLRCAAGSPLRAWAASRTGVKFMHSLTSGASCQLRGNPAPRPICCSLYRESAPKFSTTPAFWKSSQTGGLSSPRGRGHWLGTVALGTALGVSSAALIQSLHTGTFAAMPLKVNLNSAEGDWKETKDFLLSLKDKRPYYRTSKFVPLEDIPLWTPSGGAEQSKYPRNPKLDQKISVFSGDITALEIDAVVNAANNSLLGGGGVDGAIHRAAGPLLKKECASLNGCETGQAKITCAYGLPAKYVIHTVGPIAQGQVGEAEKRALRSCYKNSLQTATDWGARSVAFPCISTGIYGYPPEQAVHEALATVRDFLDEHHEKMDRVIFCVFLPTDKDLYLHNLPLYFPADAVVRSKL